MTTLSISSRRAPRSRVSLPRDLAVAAVAVAVLTALALSVTSVSAAPMGTLSHPNVRSVPLTKHMQKLDSKKAMRLPISAQGVIDRTPGNLQRMRTAAAGTGHITLLNGCAATVFSTPVTIGTQTFAALVDTGSATLAVASSSCTACGDTTLSPRYQPGPGAQQQDGTVEAVYGSGSWSGRAFKDDVSIAGLGSVHMTIGAIDTSSSFFRRSSCQATWQTGNTYQGILGLAYGSIAPPPTDSYWDELVGTTDTPDVFTIQMCTATGRMWAGGYDTTFFTGSLQWVPITDEKWYVVAAQGMAVGGAAVSVSNAAFGTMIVDSGTTAILLPNAAFSAVANAINGNAYFTSNFGTDFFTAGQCVIPANGADQATLNANLPKLSITMGGVTLQMDAVSSYVLAEADGDGTRYYCPGLSGWDQSMSILGYAMMNQFTTVHDRANSRIGFARAAYCDSTTAPPVTSYDWYVTSWGSCTEQSGSCTHTRTVTCKDSNGLGASDSQCTAGSKPTLSESCTTYADGPCQYESDHAVVAFVKTDTFKYIMGGIAAFLLLCCICACCCGSKRKPAAAHSDNFHSMHPDGPGAPHYNQYQQQQRGAVGATHAAQPAHSRH